MSTLGALLAEGRALLAAAGIDGAALDARLLLAHATGETPTRIVGWPEQPVSEAAAVRFRVLIGRRARREPVAHLLGHREFWGLTFRVSPATLIPRPDSETVVEAALSRIADRTAKLRVIDVGTGTGCLLLALLSELPNAEGVGVDLSPVLPLAQENALLLGLSRRATFVAEAGLAELQPAGLLVANLPYIPSAEISGLAPEVEVFEPATALDGGTDGLDAFRALAPLLPRLLEPGAAACLEVGAGQAPAVESILAGVAGLSLDGRTRDLAGIDRVVCARRGPV